MKKLLTWQNKWYTLVEILISILIIIISSAWISFFADIISTWFKSVNLRANTMDQVEIFEEAFSDIKSNFHNVILEEWNILSNQKTWFSLLCIVNENKDMWAIIWAFDITTKKAVIWNITKYWDYNPFILYLNAADISSIEIDKTNFIQNIDFDRIIYYDKINLLKLSYNNISNSDLSKIDLSFSYTYYSDFLEMNINDVLKYNFFKTMEISIIK